MLIELVDRTETLQDEQMELIKKVLHYAAKTEQIIVDVEVSITIVSTEDMIELNSTYRNKNESTDVLSFQLDNPYMDREQQMYDGPLQIGDIVICADKVKEQSLRYNHSYDRELAFLVVHGFLHLLGYTHETMEKEKVMMEKQETILKELGLER